MHSGLVLQPARRSAGVGVLMNPGTFCQCKSAQASCHAIFSWQYPRRRFLSIAVAASAPRSPDAGEWRGIRPHEKSLLAEVYSQLRGQVVEARDAHSSASAAGTAAMGGAALPPLPGWDFTPEDERGLRFGSAYMLLTLAWNRKFSRLREVLVNANRAREGSKQVLTRLFNVISSDVSTASKLQAPSDTSGSSSSGSSKGKNVSPEKAEGGACSSCYHHVVPENLLTGLQGCLSTQLQQLLQHQVAFLAQRGLSLHAVVRPQRVVVDSVYGIVGCTRGSSATSTVLFQHGSLQVLVRRGSNSSSLGAPATMYMAKARPFDFDGAVAAAEAANDATGSSRTFVKQAEAETGTITDTAETADDGDSVSPEDTLGPLGRRQQHMATESVWRKHARERMHDILKQPLTFRQFMNMCADCGSALDRGFVVVIDFKLLCSQQLAILDSEGEVVMGSEDAEAAVHTLRLELNAKFDASNSNFLFPAFEPSGWQLMDWNYAVGPLYPVDPREISNVVILDEDKEAPNNAAACFV